MILSLKEPCYNNSQYLKNTIDFAEKFTHEKNVTSGAPLGLGAFET